MPAERQTDSVLIVSGTAKGAAFLSKLLAAPRFVPVLSASNAGEARRILSQTPCDLVLINTPLPDEFGTELAVETVRDGYAGVLLLVKGELFEQVSYKVEDDGVLTVVKPNAMQTFYQAIKLLVATRARLRMLEQKNQSLQAKMAEIRVVNRAKLLLLEQLKMDENQAHRYIEKQAMDTRRTSREVAESIIKMYGNGGAGR